MSSPRGRLGSVTHEYVLLVGGTVVRGPGAPDASAIAWAAGTIIAIGSDDEVRSISRGDSSVVDLEGAIVVAVGSGDDRTWSPAAALDVGDAATFAVLRSDPRDRPPRGEADVLALVRNGSVVLGTLTGRRM